MITQTLKLITTKDDVQIAIWKIVDESLDSCTLGRRQNILLTHGTFSDKKVCLGIAGYLAKLGHSCYIMEWRGHGDSSIPKNKFNFETIATYDFEATFDYLFDELTLNNLHVITHSGGGICLTMFLIEQHLQRDERYGNKINSISIVAGQAYGAVLNPRSHLKIVTAKVLTKLLGYIPAKRLKLGVINESYYTMSQWYDWNLSKSFTSCLTKHDDTSSKPFDYRQYMPNITTPIYAISAKGDHFIAPPSGCELFLDDFKNAANVFRQFSITNGDLEDYNHSRVMISSNAAKEIWPTIAAWIENHTSHS